MDTDEIVSDIISLTHSMTQSNYVTCSKLASNIFQYLSKIPIDRQAWDWNEFQNAFERFDQSPNHPDICRCRNLIETISCCSNDAEERNYTLGRDKTTLLDSVQQLRDLLQTHVDISCELLSKLIRQEDTRRNIIDIMNLTSMNVGDVINRSVCDIVRSLINIDRNWAISNVIDHPIIANCTRLIKNNDLEYSCVLSSIELLVVVILLNEPFPVHTFEQLSDKNFLKSIFELIERYAEDEIFFTAAIKLILAFNLRFDYSQENPIMLMLSGVDQEIMYRTFFERLILLFNRGIDPTESRDEHSVIKFFGDLVGEEGKLADRFLFESDHRLLIEIISRELVNREPTEKITTSYLSLLELFLRYRVIPTTCLSELSDVFQSYRNDEQCSEENRFIIDEILRRNFSSRL